MHSRLPYENALLTSSDLGGGVSSFTLHATHRSSFCGFVLRVVLCLSIDRP